MKANIWAGLYETDQVGAWSVPSYYCSTLNCTWAGYSSLGICSRCADISSQLNWTCEPHLADLNNDTGCDISLPNGLALGGPEGRRDHVFASGTGYPPLVYGNYTEPLATIHSIATYGDLFVDSSSAVNASECVLVPCVIRYNYSVLISSPELRVTN